MAKIIIGIPGLGNKPGHNLLEEWWIQSIIEGLNKTGTVLEEIPFRLIYWSDILHPKPESLDITDKDDPLFISEPYIPATSKTKEKPKVKKLYKKILKYIEEQLDNIFLKEDMTLNFNKVTDRIIHKYFQDLEVYYSDDDPHNIARLTIRQRLSEVLKYYIDYEILLISHSMGSIISYDVLVNNINDCKVNTLVTIGSPLGIPIVGSRIFAEQKSLRVPPNILHKWYNHSDPEDLVAIDHILQKDFSENDNKIKIQDTLVFNDYIVNEKRNPHKVYGYLRTPEMAQIIRNFLKKEESAFIKYYHTLRNRIITFWKTKIFRRSK